VYIKKERDRNRKYKIIGREVATVHNITPRDAFFYFAYLRPKPLFFLIKFTILITGGINVINIYWSAYNICICLANSLS